MFTKIEAKKIGFTFGIIALALWFSGCATLADKELLKIEKDIYLYKKIPPTPAAQAVIEQLRLEAARPFGNETARRVLWSNMIWDKKQPTRHPS